MTTRPLAPTPCRILPSVAAIRRFAVLTFTLACALPTAHGATVQTADDKSIAGAIKGIEAGDLVLQTKTDDPATTRVPLADISQITFTWQERVAATPSSSTPPPAPPATQPHSSLRWRVEFGNADHVTAGLIGWSDTGIALSADTLGGGIFTVPVDQLRGLWSTSDSLVKKARALAFAAPGQDILYAIVMEKPKDDPKAPAVETVKGVAGLATRSDGEFLYFKYDNQEQKIKLDRLVGVELAQREMAADNNLYEVFLLSTGETLSGRITGMEKNGLRITTLASMTQDADKTGLTVPMSKIDKISVRNGRLVWLGDLKPASVMQVPYLDRLMPYRVDQSLTGGSLKLSDGEVEHGIAVHSKCFLTYDLAGAFDHFHVKVGFQQPEGKLGRAALRVLGDEKVLWENPDLKGEDKPVDIDVSVQGVKTLRLEADYGKDQDVGDRVIWGDAKLLKPAAK